MSKVLGTPDPDRLLRRCRQGDSRAWSQLVEQYQALVYSVARRAGLNGDDADDVFQETFLTLYRNLDRLQDGRALPRWLAVVGAREAVRRARLSGRSVSLGDDERSLEDLVADEDARADEIATTSEDAERIAQALRDLSGRCEELLKALFVEEADYQTISARLGMPIGAIGPNRMRCLEKLRKILDREGFFQDDVSGVLAPTS